MKQIIISVVVVVAVVSAYFLGQRSTSQTIAPAAYKAPENMQEVSKLEEDFKRQQTGLADKLAVIQNQIETVKINLHLGQDDNEIQSQEIREALAELDDQIATMQASQPIEAVVIPPDSPSGRVANQPRTASGISVKVLEDYERETGVSPDEIEELMQRKN